MLYGYARCSTNANKQDITTQTRALKDKGVKANNIYLEYESGTKRNRIELNRLLDKLQEGDTLIVTELSRISRSMKDLIDILDLLKDKKIKIMLGDFTLDFRDGDVDPMVMGMVQMMGVFSEMEREITSARIKSGIENARAKGKRVGRERTTVDTIPNLFKRNYIKYKNGQINVTELGRLSEIKSRVTVYKYIKLMQESETMNN